MGPGYGGMGAWVAWAGWTSSPNRSSSQDTRPLFGAASLHLHAWVARRYALRISFLASTWSRYNFARTWRTTPPPHRGAARLRRSRLAARRLRRGLGGICRFRPDTAPVQPSESILISVLRPYPEDPGEPRGHLCTGQAMRRCPTDSGFAATRDRFARRRQNHQRVLPRPQHLRLRLDEPCLPPCVRILGDTPRAPFEHATRHRLRLGSSCEGHSTRSWFGWASANARPVRPVSTRADRYHQ